MLMNQTSLKELDFYLSQYDTKLLRMVNFSNLPFTTYPKATECLRNLSKLDCTSDIGSEFFCQMSQICYHLQSLHITIKSISDGLSDLISNQQNLKYLGIFSYSNDNFAKIIPSMTKLSNDLIKLSIGHGRSYPISSLSFITKLTNLQELDLSLHDNDEGFKTLQYVTFSRLQVIRFNNKPPGQESLVKFLEINGMNLKEIHIQHGSNLQKLAIAKYCRNLKLL